MRIDPEKERPVDTLGAPVPGDGIRHGEHVRFVERTAQRRAAVTRRAESNAFREHR